MIIFLVIGMWLMVTGFRGIYSGIILKPRFNWSSFLSFVSCNLSYNLSVEKSSKVTFFVRDGDRFEDRKFLHVCFHYIGIGSATSLVYIIWWYLHVLEIIGLR